MKIDLVELPGPSNNDPVIAEEETAQRSDQGDSPDIEALPRHDRGRQWSGGEYGTVHRYSL